MLKWKTVWKYEKVCKLSSKTWLSYSEISLTLLCYYAPYNTKTYYTIFYFHVFHVSSVGDDFLPGNLLALASVCQHDIMYVAIKCIFKTLLQGSCVKTNQPVTVNNQLMELMFV